MNKNILWVVIILVVVIGGYFFFAKEDAVVTPESADIISTENIPVEPDNGIGDGAQPLEVEVEVLNN
ncbi:hypothetical protein KJ603_02590 [Patescibacteria group bacterium]|nr:hypothetical protein [Patescibacteria group bacterium]